MFDFLKRTPATQVDKLIKRLTETGGEDGPRIEAAQKLDELNTPEATCAQGTCVPYSRWATDYVAVMGGR